MKQQTVKLSPRKFSRRPVILGPLAGLGQILGARVRPFGIGKKFAANQEDGTYTGTFTLTAYYF